MKIPMIKHIEEFTTIDPDIILVLLDTNLNKIWLLTVVLFSNE